MASLDDVPFDVFCSILQWTDPESLHSISQCNNKFREWASSPALWKEVIRRMQARGLQLPPSGFTSIRHMSFPELQTSALRASRIHRHLTSRTTAPTRTTTIDCSPSRDQHGTTSIYQTTQRIRWVIAISQDWFAIKLGYHMSTGFLQIWKKGEESPRAVMQYRHDWIMWGCCTDLDRRAWYFLLTEDNPNQIQIGHTMRLLKFDGFDSSRKMKLDHSTAASFPAYGSPITAFFLNIEHRRLCILYAGTQSQTVTLFFIPDWESRVSVYVDSGIDEVHNKSSFICGWDESEKILSLQYDVIPKIRGKLLVYPLSSLMQHALPDPARAFPPLRPPLLKSSSAYTIEFATRDPRKMAPDTVPFHELKSAVFCDNAFAPANAHTARETPFPSTTSALSFAASFGRDLNPAYVFEHIYASAVPPQDGIRLTSDVSDSGPGNVSASKLFARRMTGPLIRRMAFEQDYMDRNSAERFPIGHALDLRGHELAALGQGCAAWIEVKEGPPANASFDGIQFDLKVVFFPWNPHGDRVEERVEDVDGLVVCSVQCPPFVDLATVTGIWLDAVQGQIFLGLKWGKFIILQFD